MKNVVALGTVILLAACGTPQSDFVPLFDGRSLNGWEGDHAIFRVADGAIVAGDLDSPVPESVHLCTMREFGDFELRVSGKVEGNQNAGVGFRSHRLPDSKEVASYQADMGHISASAMPIVSDITDVDGETYPLWGSLLDEFRPDPGRYPDPTAPYRLIAVADRDVVEQALRPDDWNDITVIAEGPRIQIQLNGMQTVDFVEEQDVPRTGKICLQLHSGSPSRASYRDIVVRELPIQ